VPLPPSSPPLRLRSGTAVAGLLWAALVVIPGCSGGGSNPPPTFTATATAGSNGTISPSSASAQQGNSVSFELLPEPGYTVDSFSGCGATREGNTLRTAPLTVNCAVTVSFRLPRVSGRVIPAGGTAVDGDVNDPLADFRNNSGTVTLPQPLGNPATLGGYVNVAGAGPPGRSQEDGDTLDVYRVSLFSGQTITLQIASNTVSDDLDLFLLDDNRTIVDASLSARSRVESVTVPGDAGAGARDWLVAVTAFSGASNYLLTIDEPPFMVAAEARLSSDFVPGEVLLDYDPGARSTALGRYVDAAGLHAQRAQEAAPRTLRLPLPPPQAGPGAALAALGTPTLPAHYADLLERFAVMAGHREKLETLLALKLLRTSPGAGPARLNYVYELQQSGVTPNDPLLGRQWHYDRINLAQAWQLSTGRETVVAVIDSGVLLDHPDLRGRSLGGYDFLRNQPGGNDPGENPVPAGGSTFHGTHVAGTIGAIANNGTGIAGVAFDTRVMPLRVCQNNRCTGFAIEQAVRYALGLPNDSGRLPPVTASVINLSLGRLGAAVAAEQALYNEARSRGVVVVASAGNDGGSARFYPAAYAGVIAVGATDPLNRRAPYSNFGDWIDLVAPGGDMRQDLTGDGAPDGVLSTFGDDRSPPLRFGYAFLEGTSMAAPHVAGTLALMRAAAPALTPAVIDSLLREGALTDDLGPTGFDAQTGMGLLNAAKAVNAAVTTAGSGGALPPRLSASPAVVNFGATREEIEVTLNNAGGGELSFGQPSENAGGWLSVTDLSTPTDRTAQRLRLRLRVDRSALAEGSYEAQVLVPSSANSVAIGVLIRVINLPDAEIGQQYVLLLDPDSFTTEYEGIGQPQTDGSYLFRIDDVAAGTYLLISGSDPDNDGLICDRAESCGVFRSVSDTQLIRVEGPDIADLEFISGYTSDIAISSLDGTASGARDQAGFRRLKAGAAPRRLQRD